VIDIGTALFQRLPILESRSGASESEQTALFKGGLSRLRWVVGGKNFRVEDRDFGLDITAKSSHVRLFQNEQGKIVDGEVQLITPESPEMNGQYVNVKEIHSQYGFCRRLFTSIIGALSPL